MARQYPLCFLALLLAAASSAQTYNALNFDGVNDKVTVPAASALITGGTGISLTCWVYPSNAAPSFPDFDGFAGMRNDNDADFYLLQVSPGNNLEARFRNSTGQDFTLEYSGLQLNTWQFLAFTYDGSQLTVYANGVNVATAPANGTITNDVVDLLIGDVYYQGTDFLLNGGVDEVSLWNRGLTQDEVNCIYASGVSVATQGVQLYYKMDQGIASGNNSGINNLTDLMGHINGELSGFALTGGTSNFVVGPHVGTSISASICQGGSYAFNGQLLDSAGVYSAAFAVGDPCDSLVTLTLKVNSVDTTVIQVAGTLTSTAGTGAWQWLDCGNNYAPVPGATAQSFTPGINGSYALAVTQNSCTDTSSCHEVLTIGIIGHAGTLQATVFPDPATDHVRIETGRTLSDLVVTVCNADGRGLVRKEFGRTGEMDLTLTGLAPGMYMVHLRSAQGSGVYRLVKE